MVQTTPFHDILEPIGQRVAAFSHLPHLATHFPTLVGSFLLWNVIQYVLSPILSPLLSSTYANSYNERRVKPGEKKAGASNGSNGKADKSKATAPRSLKGWHTRSVAFSHAVLVLPLAIQCLNLPGVDGTRGRAFGWDEKVGFVHGIACGFLWDTVDSIIHFEDIGFILHGIACLTVFLFGYRPFLAYYGPRFLLWELSTPFLNLNWFFDRTRVKGTTIHLLNGVALLISFFSARLVYGTYMSYNFFRTTYLNRSEIPAALFWTYCIGNVLLNGLNWFWFSKMVKTVRRKFASSR